MTFLDKPLKIWFTFDQVTTDRASSHIFLLRQTKRIWDPSLQGTPSLYPYELLSRHYHWRHSINLILSISFKAKEHFYTFFFSYKIHLLRLETHSTQALTHAHQPLELASSGSFIQNYSFMFTLFPSYVMFKNIIYSFMYKPFMWRKPATIPQNRISSITNTKVPHFLEWSMACNRASVPLTCLPFAVKS